MKRLMLMLVLLVYSMAFAVDIIKPRGRTDYLPQDVIDLVMMKLAVTQSIIKGEPDKDSFLGVMIDLDGDDEDDCPVLMKDQQDNYYMLILLQVNRTQWVACYRGI